LTEPVAGTTEAAVAPPPSTGVGRELAAAREARGLAIADVAQSLKFAPRQLEALEQERFDALPGATFARGMVRSYARLLQIDPAPLLERIGGRVEVPDANRLAARYHQPVPFSDSTRRSTFVYLGLTAGVLVVVGAVAYGWHQEREAAAKAPKATAVATAAPREAKRPAAAPASTPAPSRPAVAPVAEAKPVAAKPVAAKPATVAAAPAAAAPAASPPKTITGPHRLVVRTEEEAWVEIRDSADRLLVSSLNPAGSERVVRGRPPYEVVIGNAPNVRILYDDKSVDLAPHTKGGVARLTIP
jgi:cytoskeleton protein RodZ